MEAFIKPTTKDKVIVYLNPRNIAGFTVSKHGSTVTTMVPIDTWGINQLIVLETPEEIYSKLNARNREVL